MFGRANLGYDQSYTVFSPDGRLFQVEYALEAIKRGLTSIGIKSNTHGVVFVAEKHNSPLTDESEENRKIFTIDDHIGLAMAGLSADARILVRDARVAAQNYALVHGEPPPVEYITKHIASLKHLFTFYAGARPFGVSFILGGITRDKVKLYLTEPSGSIFAYKAVAIGQKSATIQEFLEKEYEDNLTIEAAIKLGLKALKRELSTPLTVNSVEIGYIDKETQQLSILSSSEIQKYLTE